MELEASHLVPPEKLDDCGLEFDQIAGRSYRRMGYEFYPRYVRTFPYSPWRK